MSAHSRITKRPPGAFARFGTWLLALTALLCTSALAAETAREWQPQIGGNATLTVAMDAQGNVWEIRHGEVRRSPYANVAQLAGANRTVVLATEKGEIFIERLKELVRLAPDIKTTQLAMSELEYDSGKRYLAHSLSIGEFNCLVYAVGERGELYAWGNRRFGLMGNGKTGDYRAEWTQVPVPPVAHVSTSGRHTALVTAEGDVMTWGLNWDGQLGLTGNAVDAPTLVQGLPKAASVFCGASYTLVVGRDGTLWGSGRLVGNGNLAPGKTTFVNLSSKDTPGNQCNVQGVFQQVKLPDLVTAVAGCDHNVLAVLRDGSCYAWGSNYSTKPTKQRLPEIAAVYASNAAATMPDHYYIAVAKDGKVYRRGSMSDGRGYLMLKEWTYSGLNLAAGTYDPPRDPLFATLQKGDKGDDVLKLRQALKDAGYLGKKAKGSYDAAVVAAVTAFQKANGLEETGIADEATQCALYRVALPTPVPQPSVQALAIPTAAPAATKPPLQRHAFPQSAGEAAFQTNEWESGEATVAASTPGYCYYVQIRNAGDDMVDGQVWLASSQSKATVSLPYGSYYLQLAAGKAEQWYGEENLFGDAGLYQNGGVFTLDEKNKHASISLMITTETVLSEGLTAADF